MHRPDLSLLPWLITFEFGLKGVNRTLLQHMIGLYEVGALVCLKPTDDAKEPIMTAIQSNLIIQTGG